jgi:hypothetical protein
MDPCNEHAPHSKLRIGARLIYHVTFGGRGGDEKLEREITHTRTLYIDILWARYYSGTTVIDNEFESIQPKASARF